MRHALIIAGGSGTRLWPMSRNVLPKQLIRFIRTESGPPRSLLQIAFDRVQGLVPKERQHLCAGLTHRQVILDSLPELSDDRYIGEPMGRDTLNAVGLSAAVIAQKDPQAVIAVFTADHVIEPPDEFKRIVQRGFEVAESQPNTLVTFGITPTAAATGYGYLELGEPLQQGQNGESAARVVKQFKEKPDLATAQKYLAAGPGAYLWNSGLFVWKASTVLECIRSFAPENYQLIMSIAGAWEKPDRQRVLEETYPKLKKISVDFAVMEPASRDGRFKVAAVPMPLRWLDVGSWPSFAQTCKHDEKENAVAADRCVLLDSSNCLVASSDEKHLVATIGCENIIVIHTPDATLVCRADRAEDLKKLHALVGEKFGPGML